VGGQWIGQDGKDFVGPSPVAGPDGIQDIHIRLTGLPTNRMIRFVDIQGYGGSRWQYGAPRGNWKAAVFEQRPAGTADVYIQPDRKETGRPFQITILYGDGSTSQLWLYGGAADPSLKVRFSAHRKPVHVARVKAPALRPTVKIPFHQT
jgi:hypothetical protein